MTRTVLSWRWLFLGCAVLALALTATARAADEDGDQGKRKGKGSKAKPTTDTIIQVDTSKLLPELVKQLQKYLKPEKRKGEKKNSMPDRRATKEKYKKPEKRKGAKAKGGQQPRMEGFGKFVEAQVARGLRGTALAAKIHQEQARRKVGQGKGSAESPPKKRKKGGD